MQSIQSIMQKYNVSSFAPFPYCNTAIHISSNTKMQKYFSKTCLT